MITLRFSIVDGVPAPDTAAPAVRFRLHIDNPSPARIHALALRVQVQIEPRSRAYDDEERARLYELFGDGSTWERSRQPLLWTHASTVVTAFDRETEVDLLVACTYDLDVASAKFLHAVRKDDVPLRFLFSGTIFGVVDGALNVQPVPWQSEADYRLPADVWQQTMDQFFPGGGWMRVSRETLDRLQAWRGVRACISWDETLDALMRAAATDHASRGAIHMTREPA